MSHPASILNWLFTAFVLAGSVVGQDRKVEVPLISISEIRAMSDETVDSKPTVRVQGVVSFFDDVERKAFLQDGDSGIFFFPGNDFTDGDILHLRAGDQVELEGIVEKGDFAPVLSESRRGWRSGLRFLGRKGLPEPVRLPTDRYFDSEFHNRFVTLPAVIRTMTRAPEREWLIFSLSTPDGMLEAVIPHFGAEMPIPAHWKDMPVVVHGVISGHGEDRELHPGRFVVILYVPSLDHVSPQTEEIERVFASRARPVENLLKFDPDSAPDRRILIRGVVTHQLREKGIFVRNGSSGLWVKTSQRLQVVPGDVIAAAGFFNPLSGRPVLEDAIIRLKGKTKSPAPLRVSLSALTSGYHHANLVELAAEVVSTVPGVAHQPTIVLEAEGHRFRVNGAPAMKLPFHPELGSLVRVAGICLTGAPGTDTLTGEDRNFSLIVRSSNDLALLRSPPWWTQRRLLMLLASMLAIILGYSLWIGMLRKRVAGQTALIRQNHEHEAVWGERNRIARELHDTLEQQLLGITLQLESASARLATAPEQAEVSLLQMRKMIQHSREEARRSVWDLRSQTLESKGMIEAVREIADSLAEQSRCSFEIIVEGIGRRLNPKTEFHLMRMVQESMTNAIKHGDAEHVRVTIAYEIDSIRIEVSDDGKGFDSNSLQQGGHFGLLGMRERAAKLNGELHIESAPGQGCLVRLKVKLAMEPQSLESL